MNERIIPLEDGLNLVALYTTLLKAPNGSETLLNCTDTKLIGPNNEIHLRGNKVILSDKRAFVLAGDATIMETGIRS